MLKAPNMLKQRLLEVGVDLIYVGQDPYLSSYLRGLRPIHFSLAAMRNPRRTQTTPWTGYTAKTLSRYMPRFPGTEAGDLGVGFRFPICL